MLSEELRRCVHVTRNRFNLRKFHGKEQNYLIKAGGFWSFVVKFRTNKVVLAKTVD